MISRCCLFNPISPLNLQRIKQNNDEFKALADSIAKILDILHIEAKTGPETARNSVQFIKLCADFEA